MKEKQTPISIRYIDTDLFENLIRITKNKNYEYKTKTDLIEFVLQDYVNMNDYSEYENPYIVKTLTSVIEAAVSQSEKNLGGRLTKLVAEEAINLGILNRIVLDFLNKYPLNQSTEGLLQGYRQSAVNDLRENKPITYISLLKDEEE